MIHFKRSHFIQKIVQAELPKMELLWRRYAGLFLEKTPQTQLLKNWLFFTGDPFYLH